MTWEEIEKLKEKNRDELTPRERGLINLQTVKPYNLTETDEQISENRRKAGIASGKVRREKKLLRDIANELMSADFSAVAENDEKLSQMLQLLGNKQPTGGDLMMLSAMIKGIRGDVDALKFVRDTSGQRPADVQAVTVSRGDLAGVDLRTVSTEELLQIASSDPAPEDDDVTQT